MRMLGPETSEDRELREWFEQQKRGNIDRLEAGAQTLIQLVTGLYGVVFAVLALGDQQANLGRASVRWAGSIGTLLFFGALLAAVQVVWPRANSYQPGNLSEMQQVYERMVARKARWLRVAQGAFLLGMICLLVLIFAILWNV